jgi:hypothetical protein
VDFKYRSLPLALQVNELNLEHRGLVKGFKMLACYVIDSPERIGFIFS